MDHIYNAFASNIAELCLLSLQSAADSSDSSLIGLESNLDQLELEISPMRKKRKRIDVSMDCDSNLNDTSLINPTEIEISNTSNPKFMRSTAPSARILLTCPTLNRITPSQRRPPSFPLHHFPTDLLFKMRIDNFEMNDTMRVIEEVEDQNDTMSNSSFASSREVSLRAPIPMRTVKIFDVRPSYDQIMAMLPAIDSLVLGYPSPKRKCVRHNSSEF